MIYSANSQADIGLFLGFRFSCDTEGVNGLLISTLIIDAVTAESHMENFGEDTPEELEPQGYIWHSPSA